MAAQQASAPLAAYNRKRDFSKTREPDGMRETSNDRLFVVQKHDATRLHWGFRLEMDGVLKSWAVTRGPSLNPNDKRLADAPTLLEPLHSPDLRGWGIAQQPLPAP